MESGGAPALNPQYDILLLFTVFGFGAIIRSVMLKLNIRLSYTVLIFILGGLIGWIGVELDIYDTYTELSNIPTKTLIFIFLPALVFKTAYSMDYHTFTRGFWQILVLAVPGFLFTVVLTATLIKFIIQFKWDFGIYLLLGLVTTVTYSHDLVALLKELGESKQLCILLEGESLIGSGAAIVLFHLVLSLPTLEDGLRIFVELLKCFIGGPLLGLVMGKITSLCLSYLFHDPLANVTLTLVAAYLSFFLGDEFLNYSGVMSVVVLGVVLSRERGNFSTEIDVLLTSFWDVITYLATTLVFIIVGIVIAEDLIFILRWKDLFYVLIIYVVSTVTRFVMFLIISPLLARLGYGLPWRNGLVAAWAGPRGPLSLCLALHILRTKAMESIGAEFIIIASAMVMLTLIIHGSTVNKLMKILGMRNITLDIKTNMNNAIRYLYTIRARSMCMLKMDRFLADANWELVGKGTTINHPYNLQYQEEDYDVAASNVGYNFSGCPECINEASLELTENEFLEISKAAKLRILKRKQVSYWHQLEHGMLSREGARALIGAVEAASDREDPVMKVEDLKSVWIENGAWMRVRKRFLAMMLKAKGYVVSPPRQRWRIWFFKTASSKWFIAFISLTILINSVSVITELCKNPYTLVWMNILLKSTNTLCFTIFVAEVVIKDIAYGFKNYITSHWNKFDIVLVFISFADLMIDYSAPWTSFQDHESISAKVLTSSRLLKLLCFIKHCTVLAVSTPQFVHLLDSRINSQHSLGYDIGTGFVTGEEEVDKLLPQIAENKKLLSELKSKVETDRLIVSKQMGLIQRDMPWIAVSVKTRQVIRSILNKMREAVYEMKDGGLLDEVEFKKLRAVVDRQIIGLNARGMALVEPCLPQTLIRELPWLIKEDSIAEFILDNAVLESFNQGEMIITANAYPEALYILVTGFVNQTYIPNPASLERLLEYGALPNVDYISSLNYSESHQEYIVSGNVIGELGVLTNRTYDSTVTCDTSVQVYKVHIDVILEAFKMSNDISQGLQARIWKAVSIRIATVILMNVSMYKSWSLERIKFHLERSFVPTLKGHSSFFVSNMMEDVLLIEGQVTDANTKTVYRAPTYIPRTIQKLLFPESRQMSIEPKLLIIPMKDVDSVVVMNSGLGHQRSTGVFMCPKHSLGHNNPLSKTGTSRDKKGSEKPDTSVPVDLKSTVLRVEIPNTLGPFAASKSRMKSLIFSTDATQINDPDVDSSSARSCKSLVLFSEKMTENKESMAAHTINSNGSFHIDIKTSVNTNYSGSSLAGQLKSSPSVTPWSDESADGTSKRKIISFPTTRSGKAVKGNNPTPVTDERGVENENTTALTQYPESASENMVNRLKSIDLLKCRSSDQRKKSTDTISNRPTDQVESNVDVMTKLPGCSRGESFVYWENVNSNIPSRRSFNVEGDAQDPEEAVDDGTEPTLRRLSDRSSLSILEWTNADKELQLNVSSSTYLSAFPSQERSNLRPAERFRNFVDIEEEDEESELMEESVMSKRVNSFDARLSRSSLRFPASTAVDSKGLINNSGETQLGSINFEVKSKSSLDGISLMSPATNIFALQDCDNDNNSSDSLWRNHAKKSETNLGVAGNTNNLSMPFTIVDAEDINEETELMKSNLERRSGNSLSRRVNASSNALPTVTNFADVPGTSTQGDEESASTNRKKPDRNRKSVLQRRLSTSSRSSAHSYGPSVSGVTDVVLEEDDEVEDEEDKDICRVM